MQYFCKYGFKDGNNEKLSEVAEYMRPIICWLLNKEFREQKLSYKAIECSVTSAHNEVRMIIVWEKGGKQYEWDVTYGGNPPKDLEDVLRKVGYVPVY